MKMFSKSNFSRLFFCFAAMLTTAFAQAQTADSLRTDSLKEVMIGCGGGDRGVKIIEISPLKSTTSLNIPTVGQELSYQMQMQPSVSVTSDGGGYNGYSYMRVRGIDQTRLNFSLNGVPIQEGEDQGMYFSNFPDFMQGLNSAFVENGGGRMSNGAPSFGGSVFMETKQLSDREGGSVYANYGSFNTYRVGAEYNSGIKNKLGAYLRTGYLSSDNYKQHSRNSGYSSMASLGYFGTKDVVKFTALYGNQRNQLAWLGAPLDSIEKNPRYNANTEGENDNFSQLHAQLQYLHAFNKKFASTITLYDNYNKGFYTFDSDNFAGTGSDGGLYKTTFAGNGVGAILNFKAVFNTLELNFNAHGGRYARQHIGTLTPTSDTLYQNTGQKQDLSASLFANYKLNDFTFRVSVQTRHADFSYKGDLPYAKKDWNFINPNLGIAYAINKQWSVYAKYALTNREPMRLDLFGGYDNLTLNADSTIGVDLQPEKVQDFELGTSFYNNKFSGNFNLYYMQFQNEIALNGVFGPTGLPLHIAAAQTVRSGLELRLSYQVGGGFDLQHTSNFSMNQINDGGVKSAPVLTPQIIINQGIGYSHSITQHLQWQAAMTLRYQSEAYLDFQNTAKLPAAYTADARAGITYKRFDLTLQCRNLLNQRYYSSGSVDYTGKPLYFIQAPFNFMAGAAYRF
jgi:iron complex outermembrane recepter protein